jgi:hypothetical protein
VRHSGAVILLVVGVAAAAIAQSRPSIEGAWRVTAVTQLGASGSTNTKPQPGLYLFTSKHYSIMRVLSDDARPDEPEDANSATAAELRAAWGPLQAQSGSYEIAGGTLNLTPVITKRPQAMKAPRPAAYKFTVVGNTLTLEQQSTAEGTPTRNRQIVRLTRVE